MNGKIVYQYDHTQNIFLHNDLQLIDAASLIFEYYNKHLPVLRYIANNSNLAPDSPVRSIMDYVSHMLYFRSVQDTLYIGFMTGDINISN